MGDAIRFGLGLMILLGCMIFFFFAFHPGGVSGVSNPGDMLKWLMNEFNNPGTVASNTPLVQPGIAQQIQQQAENQFGTPPTPSGQYPLPQQYTGL